MLLYSHALTLTSIHLLIFQFVLMFNWISWTNPTAKDYEFPPWAHAIGWLMISSTLIFIPIVWVWEFIRAEGTVTDVSFGYAKANCF